MSYLLSPSTCWVNGYDPTKKTYWKYSAKFRKVYENVYNFYKKKLINMSKVYSKVYYSKIVCGIASRITFQKLLFYCMKMEESFFELQLESNFSKEYLLTWYFKITDHPVSACPKFSGKLVHVTSWCAHVRVKQRIVTCVTESKWYKYVKTWNGVLTKIFYSRNLGFGRAKEILQRLLLEAKICHD